MLRQSKDSLHQKSKASGEGRMNEYHFLHFSKHWVSLLPAYERQF